MVRAISIKFLIAALVVLSVMAAMLAQLMGFINADSAWLLYAADRVYGGERLYRNVIETNPPLAIYLNLVPVILADFTVGNKIFFFKIFVFVLCAMSAFLCYRIKPSYPLTVLALLSLFVFPGFDFGQREHLFVILFLPYLFVITATNVSLTKRILASMVAAVAISLKPYFVLIWLAAVIADAINAKDLRKFFRYENWIIGFIGIAYLGYLFFVERIYVGEVLPLLLKYYDAGFNPPLKPFLLAVAQVTALALTAFGLALIKFREKVTKEAMIFGACTIGSVAAALIQQKGFSNHFMPANFFSIWLNFYLIRELITIPEKPRRFCLVAMCLIVLGQGVFVSGLTNFRVASAYKADKLKQKIALINKYASGENIYYITPDLPDAFPAILYSKGIYKGEYAHLWALPGIYKNATRDKDGKFIFHSEDKMNADEKMLIKTVVDEMNYLNPQLVIIKTKTSGYASFALGDFKFDFLAYFLRNKEFSRKWQEYTKISDIGETAIYIRSRKTEKKP